MLVSLLRSFRTSYSRPAIAPVTRSIKGNVDVLVKENGLVTFQGQLADFSCDAHPPNHVVSYAQQFGHNGVDVRGPEVLYFWEKLRKCFGQKGDKKKGGKKAKKQSCKKKKCGKQKDTCLKKKESCEKPGEKKELCKTEGKKDDKKKEEKKSDPCKKKDEKKADGDKKDPCKKNEMKKEDPCKKKEEKKEDPCKKKEEKKEDPCKKKEDPCKKKEEKKEDPCKKKEVKKEDPCKKKEEKKEDPCKKKEDPCKKKEEKKEDPCKKKEDPCKKKEEKKEDPCKKKEDPCKKKEDPCKKKEDPCKKKEDPCKKKEEKKEDPCKKKEDPCKKQEKKEDPCKKKEDPCKKKEDPCKKKEEKKEDPCKKKEDPCKKKEDPCKKDEKKEDPCEPCKKKEDPCKKKDPCAKFSADEPIHPEPLLLFSLTNARFKKEEEKCSKPCRDPCAEGACEVLPGQDEPCSAAASWKIKVRPCRASPCCPTKGAVPPSGPCIIDKVEIVEQKLELEDKCGLTKHPCGKKVCPNKCEVKRKTKFSGIEQEPQATVRNLLEVLSYHTRAFQSTYTLSFANARGPVPPSRAPDPRKSPTGHEVPVAKTPLGQNYSEKVAGLIEKLKGLWQGTGPNPGEANQSDKTTVQKPQLQPKTHGKRFFGMPMSDNQATVDGTSIPACTAGSLESLSAEGDSHILFITDDFEKCEDRVPPCPLEPEMLPCPAPIEDCVHTTDDLWSDIDANWGYERFPWKNDAIKDERLDEISQRSDDPYANNKL